MNQKITVILAGLCIVLLIGGAYFLYEYLAEDVDLQQLVTQPTQPATDGTEESQAQSNAVPDITVYDAEGRAAKLSDFRGKPVVLNFWASWCGPCKSEMPAFEQIYGKYGQQIHFLMVNITDGYQETQENASAFIAQQGYSFPVYYDMGAVGAGLFGIHSLPTTFFLNAEGNLVAHATGALNEANLEKGIAMLRGIK